MKHNWMYSFMPVGDEVFLVGYCKACDQGVSSLLPVSDYKTIVREMDIPKWGCVPKQEL
jgi:hypothetical protein